MLSQYSAPLLNPAERAQEREEMTRLRSEMRGELDGHNRRIRDSDTIDEDDQPRPPAATRGEKLH